MCRTELKFNRRKCGRRKIHSKAQGGEDADLVPGPGDQYFAPLLDYRDEDSWLAAHTANAG